MRTTSKKIQRPRRLALLGAAIAVAVGLAAPASASAAPALELTSSHVPKVAPVPVGTYAVYSLKVSNPGDATTSEPVSVDFSVPAGVEVTSVTDEIKKRFGFTSAWSCAIAGNSRSVSCTGPEFFGPLGIEPGKQSCQELFGTIPSCPIVVTVKAEEDASPATYHPTATACGGGVTSCPAVASTAPDDPFEVVPLDFHLTKFDGHFLQESGDPATQAGSHPYTASNEFFLNTALGASGEEHPIEQLKDAVAELPPGLLGNPRAYPTCAQAQLVSYECPPDTQVGTVTVWRDGQTGKPDEPLPSTVGVYNMEVPYGLPALFGFFFLGNVTEVYASLRSGEDYGVTLAAVNTPQTLLLSGVTFKFWGVPADPRHDGERYCVSFSEFQEPGCSTSAPLKPLVTLPTSCAGPLRTDITVRGWGGGETKSSFLFHDNTLPTPNPIGTDGCNAVDFSPTLEARPTTNVADSPSGLAVDLRVPQHESCDSGPPVSCENAEATLKDAVVALPQGMTVNPSSANGLGSCSEAGFGYTETDSEGTVHTTPDPASCPDAAKLGTVEVDTPLLDHPLKGAVYLAQPYQNPFGSLLALYIALDDQQTGVVVKLAGEVHADPQTGQLTTTFKQNPQLPFEDFRLHFFAGAGGSLRTPAVCATYSTTSSLTPWTAPDSGLPATPSDAWQIAQAPGGGTCPVSAATQPNSPSLDAGTISPIAGAYSPFVLNLRREDGSQSLSAVSVTTPPGFTGRLAGIPYCPDAALAAAEHRSGREEQASPSCPPASSLGTVTAAAGAGPAPYYAHGTAYLTGPYKGAPLGMAIVTPAVAGPFDLGTIVTRVALHVDQSTGQITAASDPIPSILQGIPLDVRSVQVKLDRSQFTRNGTSCDPMQVTGSVLSTLGQSASISNPFQLGECTALAFKPKLSIRLAGGTKRGAHPALRGTLAMPEGNANVAKASIALPHSEFLDQGHIGTVCTRVQFAANECPADSVYGRAVATSPLVGYPVEGPVFLRSSSHKLPDLVMALHGPASQPIEVDAVARVDSIHGGIRSTFESVPDLPLNQVTLEMQGGRKGLLQNSTDICRGVHKATAELDGQNGKFTDLTPALKGKCPKARKRHRRHRATSRHRAR